MSWQRQKEKRRSSDGPGLGTALAVGAAAVGVAALSWGAKKLYDVLSEQKTEESHGAQASGYTSPQREQPSFSRFASTQHEESFKSGPNIKIVESPKKTESIVYGWDDSSSPSSEGSMSGFVIVNDEDLSPSILQNELIDYYDTYVYIPKKDKRRAMDVGKTVMDRIQHFIQNQYPGIAEDFVGTGSAFDGTQVIKADNFDVLIPICLTSDAAEVGSQMWVTQDGKESMGWSSASGFSLVSRENIPESSGFSLSNLMDDLIIDDKFLSPMKARIFFRDLIQAAVKADENCPYIASVSTTGCATTVNILYDEKHLHLNFMPAVKLGSRLKTADPYPRCEQEHDCEEGYRKLWQDSFAFEEERKINSMDAHSKCHVRCLQLMKSMAFNDKLHLGILSSYHLKTVLLHLMDKESNWESGVLWERVKDMLSLLEFYLRERRLPHYFLPEINLLENYGRHAVDDLKNYITSVLRKESITSLLRKDIQK